MLQNGYDIRTYKEFIGNKDVPTRVIIADGNAKVKHIERITLLLRYAQDRHPPLAVMPA
jgi:hypothetical protein